ncbi:MAG: DegV family protein [Clostridiaceae bacterium]|nr:DegV family protein [Clostridiaceae bacterium]
MKKTAITTDSNSGITQAEAQRLGLHVLPMPFYINEQLYLEDITLSQPEFYRYLEQNAEISTSQPSIAAVTEFWDKALEDCDEIVHIPMSSGLSNSCETAMMLASADYQGRVWVVDNKRISWTQKQSALEAMALAQKGMDGREIKALLERYALESSIYIAVDTLKYLKKGGRITPAAASIGAVLNIKPVLQIQGGKLDAFAKVRGMKQARVRMIEAVQSDLAGRFAGSPVYLRIAYTCTEEEALEWKQQLEAAFPNHEIYMDRLSLSVSCHIGAGAMAVVCSKQLPETGFLAYRPRE